MAKSEEKATIVVNKRVEKEKYAKMEKLNREVLETIIQIITKKRARGNHEIKKKENVRMKETSYILHTSL